MSNKEKFIETFGFDPTKDNVDCGPCDYSDYKPTDRSEDETIYCDECKWNFWNSEYKEDKKKTVTISDGTVKKTSGDYIVYKREWLYAHLDAEFGMLKKALKLAPKNKIVSQEKFGAAFEKHLANKYKLPKIQGEEP